ncbi:ORF122 [Ranid herpesvirus 2]|uniref:ORF122 n=1 Tax=Ranid herpesvirus 2 TaxID=389214 RepID=Q14VY4_9VIRU|nr:ORF122 [Ranid herpesvirus 2]ABG25599.1 ORF122 [Ranid herpesvirus 2]
MLKTYDALCRCRMARCRRLLGGGTAQPIGKEESKDLSYLRSLNLQAPKDQIPSMKPAIELYLFLIYRSLFKEVKPCSRLMEQDMISLSDYDRAFSELSLNYSSWSYERVERRIKDLLLFWRFVLQFPVLPTFVDDVALCFFCLAAAPKEMARYKEYLLHTQCCHYAMPVEEEIERQEADMHTSEELNAQAKREAPVRLNLHPDKKLKQWLQGESDTKSMIAARKKEDEHYRSKRAVCEKETKNFDSLMRLVKAKGMKLKLSNRMETLERRAVKLRVTCGRRECTKFVHAEPFVQLYYFMYHSQVRNTNLTRVVEEQSQPKARQEEAEICFDKLKTTSIKSSEVISAFYLFLLPPKYSLETMLNPRFPVADLLYASRLSMVKITVFRNMIKQISYSSLCGTLFKDTCLAAQADEFCASLCRLLWSVTNIYAFCVVYNHGRRAWYRADETPLFGEAERTDEEGGCAWNLRSPAQERSSARFYHVQGLEWFIRYMHIDGRCTYYHADTDVRLLSALAALVGLLGT